MWVKHQKPNAFSVCILLSSFLVSAQAQEIRCPVQALYQLGDSISDTGNTIRIVSNPAPRRPYGETFPGFPTGRWSDGLLIIDYIAMALGLPLLNPYLDRKASFANGVNFAVAGSTANDISFYLARGVTVPPVLPPLRAQLGWFKKYLNSTATDKISNSLVFVGEIGYNDFGFSLSQGRSFREVSSYIPSIVQTIIDTTREVIGAGASQIVVPGNFPLGCFPWALITLATNDPNAYDDIGCLKSVNNLSISQNNQLQEALADLRNEFPQTVILYADNYNAFETILRNASALGFNTTVLLKQCCGIRGTYDFDSTFCGNIDATLCPNPNKYIHWDGIHLTQEAYRLIAEIIISDLKIKCLKLHVEQ